jgi:hypothetical protein
MPLIVQKQVELSDVLNIKMVRAGKSSCTIDSVSEPWYGIFVHWLKQHKQIINVYGMLVGENILKIIPCKWTVDCI